MNLEDRADEGQTADVSHTEVAEEAEDARMFRHVASSPLPQPNSDESEDGDIELRSALLRSCIRPFTPLSRFVGLLPITMARSRTSVNRGGCTDKPYPTIVEEQSTLLIVSSKSCHLHPADLETVGVARMIYITSVSFASRSLYLTHHTAPWIWI